MSTPVNLLSQATRLIAEHNGPIPAELFATVLETVALAVRSHGEPPSMQMFDSFIKLVEAFRDNITA